MFFFFFFCFFGGAEEWWYFLIWRRLLLSQEWRLSKLLHIMYKNEIKKRDVGMVGQKVHKQGRIWQSKVNIQSPTFFHYISEDTVPLHYLCFRATLWVLLITKALKGEYWVLITYAIVLFCTFIPYTDSLAGVNNQLDYLNDLTLNYYSVCHFSRCINCQR